MGKVPNILRRFDANLRTMLAPLLLEQGFERPGRARLWIQSSSTGKGICRLVWFQVAESSSLSAGRFTVEFGIYYPKYDRFMNGRDLMGPDIGACHFDVRARLGVLMQPPEDRWWSYKGDDKQAAAQLSSVARWIVELGLPWFEATDTPANAAVYNTGKIPEPDVKRREAFKRFQAGR